MRHEPRSLYEFEDPPPSTMRGQRVLLLADRLVDGLVGRGLLSDLLTARRECFHILADDLYGNASIDLPDFTDRESLDALRQGKA